MYPSIQFLGSDRQQFKRRVKNKIPEGTTSGTKDKKSLAVLSKSHGRKSDDDDDE